MFEMWMSTFQEGPNKFSKGKWTHSLHSLLVLSNCNLQSHCCIKEAFVCDALSLMVTLLLDCCVSILLTSMTMLLTQVKDNNQP